jgi:hypothetical protein
MTAVLNLASIVISWAAIGVVAIFGPDDPTFKAWVVPVFVLVTVVMAAYVAVFVASRNERS